MAAMARIRSTSARTRSDDIVIGALNPVALDTGSGNDTLDYSLQTVSIELDLGSGDLLGIESVIGGSGNDTLFGFHTDTTWNITGADSGLVEGISFAGFENLSGQADNQDTFVLSSSGSLSGILDGGDGGFDTLVLDGGNYETVTYQAYDPNSGTIQRDGDLLTYAGLEPITNTGTANAVVFSTGNFDDFDASLTDNGNGTLTLAGTTFEDVTFNDPGTSLTINLGDDPIPLVKDSLTINSFDLSGVNLTVNGEDGDDEVVFAGAVNAGNVLIDAETITVNAAVNATGDITLNAIASDDEGISQIDGILFTADSSITVSGSGELVGNNVTLLAHSTLDIDDSDFGLGPVKFAFAVGVSTALVDISGGVVNATSGNLMIDAKSDVTSTLTTVPDDAEDDDDEVDAAVASAILHSSPTVTISGGNIDASGTATIKATNTVTSSATADGLTGDQGGTVAVNVFTGSTGVLVTGGTIDADEITIVEYLRVTANRRQRIGEALEGSGQEYRRYGHER